MANLVLLQTSTFCIYSSSRSWLPFKAITPPPPWVCLLHAGTWVWNYSALYLFISSTYSQEYLQRGMSHLDEVKIHQTARYRYISVVLRCPGRGRGDGRHPAPRAVLHPPGAMHGQVECQDEVGVLAKRDRQTERVWLQTRSTAKAAWRCHTQVWDLL